VEGTAEARGARPIAIIDVECSCTASQPSSIEGLRMIRAALLAGAALLAVPVPSTVTAANYQLGKNYGGEFTLTDHQGRPFSLRDARGKVVLIHFGFTACDSTCPTTMAKITAALERLGSRAAQVQPLLISVDTQRDTPAVLRDSVRNFHPAYIGLTGAQKQVEAVARQYRAPVHVRAADHKGAYVADHGSGIYLVARDGMLADIVFYDSSPDDLAKRISGLLDH
jgi:protein SCO1/2